MTYVLSVCFYDSDEVLHFGKVLSVRHDGHNNIIIEHVEKAGLLSGTYFETKKPKVVVYHHSVWKSYEIIEQGT
jgi:hypothetical protein